jgi:hypothetical protein
MLLRASSIARLRGMAVRGMPEAYPAELRGATLAWTQTDRTANFRPTATPFLSFLRVPGVPPRRSGAEPSKRVREGRFTKENPGSEDAGPFAAAMRG